MRFTCTAPLVNLPVVSGISHLDIDLSTKFYVKSGVVDVAGQSRFRRFTHVNFSSCVAHIQPVCTSDVTRRRPGGGTLWR